MRIIGTVVFVLIAGISSSTDAQSGLRSSCAEIGAPNADEVVKRASDRFDECVSPLVFQPGFRRGFHTRRTIFKLICDTVPTVNRCRARLMHTLESCLAPDEQKYWIISSNLLVSLVQFTCDNPDFDRDNLMSIASECSNDSKYEPAINVCIHNVLPEDSAYTSSPPSKTLAPETEQLDNLLEKLNFNSEACSIIQHFEQCLINEAYNACNGNGFSNVLAFLFDYVNEKSLPCNIPTLTSVASSTLTSVASPGIIVNVLLLSIAVIATCL